MTTTTDSCGHCLPAAPPGAAQAGAPSPTKPRWYTQPKSWVLWCVLPALLIGCIWAPLNPMTRIFLDYVRMTWWAITLGFLLGGMIERFVPTEYISKFLARPNFRTILLATGLGALFSSCSHGCLALSMQLHKKGAAPAAVLSFLLASPWASLSLTLLMISLFGLKGMVLVFSALVIACLTGFAFLRLERQGFIERNPHTVTVDASFSVTHDLRRRASGYRPTPARLFADGRSVLRGAWALADMVIWWLVIGFFMASLAGAFVPHATFARYFGPTFLGLCCTMIGAAVIEICSEGSAPLAFELFKQTGALGNSFAFLMGCVVTDVTELGLIWTNLGRKTTLWMLALTLPQVFLFGLLLNRW